MRQERPRFAVEPQAHRRLLDQFIVAARSGQRDAIRALLHDDVLAIGDGGGKATAVAGGMRGGERVTNLFWAHSLRLGPRIEYRIATINGEPGFVRYVDGRLESVNAVVTDGERIVTIYAVRNPDKLVNVLL